MIWKNINNFETLYEINEFGEVRNKKSHKIITPDKNNAGYFRVNLYKNKLHFREFVHRLVATHFLNNQNNYPEVNHKDGNKTNNHFSNLEWCDRTQNEREAHRLHIKSYKPFRVTYNSGKIKDYEFAIDLAKELKVSKRTILNFLQGKSKGFTRFSINKISYL